MSRAPRNSAVSRNFVHPKSKIPVTVIFILHACTLRACSDLQVESYRVAGPLVDTLYRKCTRVSTGILVAQATVGETYSYRQNARMHEIQKTHYLL